MLIALLLCCVGVMKAQPQVGKEYRIKENAQNLYLTIRGYDGSGEQSAYGTVPLLEKTAANVDQVWTIEETGTANVYNLKSKSGYYITHGGWNINAYSNPGTKGQVEFVSNGDTYKIKNINADKWWKSQSVSYDNNIWHPFCDAAENAAASWVLEEVPADEFKSAVALTITYKFNGKNVSEATAEKTPGSEFVIPALDYTNVKSCKIGEAEAVEGETIVVPATAATIVVELEANLPFTVSDGYDNATWYAMQIRSNDKKYVVRANEAPYANDATTPTTEGALWAFVGNPIDGIQVLNKAAGKGYTLGYAEIGTAKNVYMKEGNTTWNIQKGNGGFVLRQGSEGNNYAHDYGSKLQFWVDSNAKNDPGSAFIVVSEAEMKTLASNALTNAMTLINNYEEASYYTYSNENVAVAKAALQSAVVPGALLSSLQAKAAAESAMKTLTANTKGAVAPAVGDLIVLKNRAQNKYLTDNGNGEAKVEATTKVEEAIWKVVAGDDEGAIKLQNYVTEKYLGVIAQSEAVKTVDSDAAASFTWANQTDMYAVFKPKDGASASYGHFSGGNLVGWYADAEATHWVVSNVAPMEVYYTYNGAAVKETVEAAKKGVNVMSSPYAFTKIAECYVDGEAMPIKDGKVSFEVGDEPLTVVVTLVDDLPFVPTTIVNGKFAEDTEWYMVKHHSNSQNVWQVDENLTSITTVGSTALDMYNDRQLWCFVGNAFDGIKVYNKAAGAAKWLKNTKDDDGATLAADGFTWKIANTAIEPSDKSWTNPFCLKDDTDNNYLNWQGNKLKYWGSADQGSTLAVVSFTEMVVSRVKDWNAWLSLEESVLGGLASTEELASLVNTYKNNPTKANEDAVNTHLEEAPRDLPKAGKYYQLISAYQAFPDTVSMAIYGNGDASAWKALDNDRKEFYWTITPKTDSTYAFVNMSNGRYLNGKTLVEADTVDTKLTWLALGEFNIISNGVKLHAQSHGDGKGTEGAIVDWDGGANSPSSWKIKEVEYSFFYDIIYDYQYNGKTVFADTTSIKDGGAYPDFKYVAPWGVKIADSKPAGTVSKAETVVVALANDSLPFEFVDSYADIKDW